MPGGLQSHTAASHASASATGMLCSELGCQATSSCPTGVFTKLGYSSLDTAFPSEITSANRKSDMVIINFTSATTEELLNRTIPGLLP
jgi:hypothetical protein